MAKTITNNIFELQVNNFQKKLEEMDQDESISTPKLTIFGIQDCHLQFYPNGSFENVNEGHCSFVFGCPYNIQLEIEMYIGNCTLVPIEIFKDKGTNERLYGIVDFGKTEDLYDKNADAIVVGVELKSITFEDPDDKENEKVVRVTID